MGLVRPHAVEVRAQPAHLRVALRSTGSSLSIRTCAFESQSEGPERYNLGHLPMSLSPGSRLGSYEVTALIG